jgi:hypothetical protein
MISKCLVYKHLFRVLVTSLAALVVDDLLIADLLSMLCRVIAKVGRRAKIATNRCHRVRLRAANCTFYRCREPLHYTLDRTAFISHGINAFAPSPE